jgi:hypothetical protein
MVAATGGQVAHFRDARHFASWFGLTPTARAISGASRNAAIAICACCSRTARARCCAQRMWHARRGARSMTFGIGRSKSRSARITTRPRAPWLTNWRASHLPVCATKRRTQPQSRGSAKKLGARHFHCPHEPARDEYDLSHHGVPLADFIRSVRAAVDTSAVFACNTATPNLSLRGVDRPSWHPGPNPHRLTPITLPAASACRL